MSSLATSSDPDFDLTLEASLQKQDNSLSLLYPPMSPDYFRDKPDALVSTDKNIIEKYNDAPIKPYIKKRDLADPFGDQNIDGGSKNAWEIGLKFNF